MLESYEYDTDAETALAESKMTMESMEFKYPVVFLTRF